MVESVQELGQYLHSHGQYHPVLKCRTLLTHLHSTICQCQVSRARATPQELSCHWCVMVSRATQPPTKIVTQNYGCAWKGSIHNSKPGDCWWQPDRNLLGHPGDCCFVEFHPGFRNKIILHAAGVTFHVLEPWMSLTCSHEKKTLRLETRLRGSRNPGRAGRYNTIPSTEY